MHAANFVRLIMFAGSICVSGCLAPESSAQPLSIESILLARRFSEHDIISFSPDDRHFAYSLRERDPDGEQRTRSHGGPWWAVDSKVYVFNTETRKSRQISPQNADSWAPAWSPDGRYVAYIGRGEGVGEATRSGLWLWDAASGNSRQISDRHLSNNTSPMWSANGHHLLVSIHSAGAPQHPTYEERNKLGTTVQVYSWPAVADGTTADGGWSLSRPLTDICWIAITGGAADCLATKQLVSSPLKLSPDGELVAFASAKRFAGSGSQQVLFDIVVVGQRQVRVVATDVPLDYDGSQFTWTPDSKRLVYRAAGMQASGDLYVATVDGNSPQLITNQPHPNFNENWEAARTPLTDVGGVYAYFTAQESVWRAKLSGAGIERIAAFAAQSPELIGRENRLIWATESGRNLMLLTRSKSDGSSSIRSVDLLTGSRKSILTGSSHLGGTESSNGLVVTHRGQKLVYVSQSSKSDPNLFLFDVTRPGSQRQITDLNPAIQKIPLGDRRFVSWRSIDGDNLSGLVLLPSGYQRGQKYPLITKVYGGSYPVLNGGRFGSESSWVDNLQLLATRGYAVFLPNLPLRKDGQVAADLLKMVMPGVDKVIDIGVADPRRLGVVGHSFGGYNTIALITQTTRFNVAVMSAGLADVTSAFGQLRSDGSNYGIAVIENGQFSMRGTPWDYPQRYYENSPVHHLDRVQTPLLIVHGASDAAVAAHLSEEVFVGLRRLNKQVQYAKYIGENHHQETWSFENQKDYWNRVIGWFDKYLKSR